MMNDRFIDPSSVSHRLIYLICPPSSVIYLLSVGGEGGRQPIRIRTTNPEPPIRRSTVAKKVTGFLKLQVPAGSANPSPPIGPALGQRGLNIMEFCKAFNAQTQKMEKGTPIPVVITTYQDRSFTFELKTPPVSYFIKKAAKLESGSKTPGRDKAGTVTKAQVREIAQQKMKDLNCDTIEAAMRMVEGSARSMGVEVAE